MSFYGYHGVSAAEKETGRLFEVDCEIEIDLAQAGHSDMLVDTVDYSHVYEIIRETVEGKAFSLIEKLAEHLADILLEKFPVYRVILLEKFPVYRVTLKVRKMNPPIPGQIKFIEVEITRFQSDADKLIDNVK